MTKVNVQEAKTQLSRLISMAEANEEVVITRHGKPVVRLIRVQPNPKPRKLGTWAGSIKIADDFNDELDPSIMAPLVPE